MCDLLNRLRRSRGGVAAVEFALVLPLLLLILVAIVEIGRVMSQASAVEKGLRAGAQFAARSSVLPLTGSADQQFQNLVKWGNVDGTGSLLVDGWADANATLSINLRNDTVGGNPVTVIRVQASVPYDPLLSGLAGFFGLDSFTITTSHEQTYIGY